jgi:hypothetical protein
MNRHDRVDKMVSAVFQYIPVMYLRGLRLVWSWTAENRSVDQKLNGTIQTVRRSHKSTTSHEGIEIG